MRLTYNAKKVFFAQKNKNKYLSGGKKKCNQKFLILISYVLTPF